MRAKPIMIQGTMSNAGKSLIAAGLCRIFSQDGYRVAPFKSQNMALNSFITEEGLEMGRAQVVQAEAAGVTPSVDMNPILLKPTTDVGSQVIVRGVPIGNMKARDYFAYKKELIPTILESYERLAAEYDIIVIEGAGSPAEINLNQNDIVNMGMAKMANAPVLLVGDIDRGGVFAQLYGTVALLKEEERARIAGLLINKFRGDPTILEPGIRMIEELCKIPVVGVAPYLPVAIEDEDSLSASLLKTQANAPVDVAVIRLPRLSNFTDFDALGAIPALGVRYVERVDQLKSPDLVILPGTKNTISDLLWLREQGLEAAILKLADRGVPVFGICGGFQMLGETICDASGTESEIGRTVRGMGLLPLVTVFEEEKVRTRVEGAFGTLDGVLSSLSGHAIEGYEIHMGRTRLSDGLDAANTAICVNWRKEPVVLRPTSWVMETQKAAVPSPARMDGGTRGNVYGTYLHGIFDAPGVAEELAKSLLRAKGLSEDVGQVLDYAAFKGQEFEKLARGLREHLDMAKIYEIMGLEENGKEEARNEDGVRRSAAKPD